MVFRFSCFGVFCLALVACGNGLPVSSFDAGIGGSGGDSMLSSSSTVSSSSSSGAPTPFVCPGDLTSLAPINGDANLPYFENGAHACRRFVPVTYPSTYTTARIEWQLGPICQDAPRYTWAVAQKDALTGFVFGVPAVVPSDFTVPIKAKVVTGEALFVCAVLSVLPRSCILGCHDKLDDNSFWSDDGPDGKTIVPITLELLSVAPTQPEASAFGNDLTRLMIDAW